MDLKFRRNLPLLLLFVALVALLVLGLGNQPIVSYTLGLGDASASRSPQDVDLIAGVAELLGLSTTEEAQIGSPGSDAAGPTDQVSVLSVRALPSEDDPIRADLDSENTPALQFDGR